MQQSTFKKTKKKTPDFDVANFFTKIRKKKKSKHH